MISPLLANIYLPLFDRAFLIYCRATGLKANLVRYADDFVILMRGAVEETYRKVKQVLERLDLTLHEEKSRVIDARKESFDFLGFTFCRKRNFKTGKVIALVEPSRKSEQKFRDELRGLTSRLTHCVGQDEVLQRVNRYVRGWVNYFHLHNSTRVFCGNAFSWNNGSANTCRSDDRSRGLDFADGRPLDSIKSLAYTPFRNTPRTGALVCVEMNGDRKAVCGRTTSTV